MAPHVKLQLTEGPERVIKMKKFYVRIFNSESGANIEICEYTQSNLENSINDCIKQQGWNPLKCSYYIRAIEIKAETV